MPDVKPEPVAQLRGGIRPVEPDDEPKLCSWADEYENADGACFPRWCGQPGAVTVDGELLCEGHAEEAGCDPGGDEE